MNNNSDNEKGTGEKTVIVADDEEELRNVLSQLLGAKGFRVLTASNGLEALEHTKSLTPDIIVSDVNMPEMGGKELYKEILTDEGKPKYPFLFLATRGELSDFITEDIEDVGFIGKPFQLAEILSTIKSLIKD